MLLHELESCLCALKTKVTPANSSVLDMWTRLHSVDYDIQIFAGIAIMHMQAIMARSRVEGTYIWRRCHRNLSVAFETPMDVKRYLSLS